MMESAHNSTSHPETNGMPPTEEFDDPFKSTSSNFDDLALDNDNAAVVGEGSAPTPTTANVEEEADPWAVLAAAAGEEAPQPAPAATAPAASAEIAEPISVSTPAAAADEQPKLAHAEGETFAMPNDNTSSQAHPSLASQIHSSTANLSQTLTSKIQQVDANIGISTKAHDINSQYHLTEKWSNFNDNVLKPTTTKTVEKTKDISSNVSATYKEKVDPKVKEHWGSIKARSTEMGITQKWSSLSNVMGSKWQETKEHVGVSVERLKEEQERKKSEATANASNGEGGQQQQLQQNLAATKEKVVESWTGGMNWVSQRLSEAKQQHAQGGQSNGVGGGGTGEMSRLDSDGLPSSFRKDA